MSPAPVGRIQAIFMNGPLWLRAKGRQRENIMLRYLSLICTSWLFALAAMAPVQAGEASRVSSAAYVTSPGSVDALFQRAASKPCCYNDGDYFYSSPSTCRKYGGRVVHYDYCQRQYYAPGNSGPSYSGKPCCFNSGGFFNATPKTCRRYGGRVVSQERCDRYYDQQQWGDDQYAPNAEKPCCYNNGRYYNSTPKTCRKFGGRVVHQGYCTRQYDNY